MEEFYKKKIIRDFLSLFSQCKWKNLCILCMEYGILILKKNYQISSLSMDDIEQFVEDLQEEQNKKSKKDIKKKYEIATNTAALKNNLQNPNSNKVNNYTNSESSQFSVSNSRPSSNWRKGENKTIFDYKDNMANTLNDIGMNKLTKEKMLDEILYPKQNKIINRPKDYRIIGDKKEDKGFAKRNNDKISNIKYQRPLSKDNRSTLNQSIKRFKSGLQMLKMRAPSENKTNKKLNRSFTDNNSKFKNVPSKIKSQIESDKKIYQMLKQKKLEEKKSFEERESSITYRRSETSFEDGLSSFV